VAILRTFLDTFWMQAIAFLLGNMLPSPWGPDDEQRTVFRHAMASEPAPRCSSLHPKLRLDFELYKNLRLQADLWAFYLEASVYGQEVFTCGGARGPAHAYFVPLLSGLQLFASVPPGESGEVPDPPPAGGERLFACDGGEQALRIRVLDTKMKSLKPYI